MESKKYLFLNGVEEKELKKVGQVVVSRKGINYLVTTTEEGVKIKALTESINVVCPLDLPKGSIILTHEENRELKNTGFTTHEKGGIKYAITRNEFGETTASVECEYNAVILKSEC